MADNYSYAGSWRIKIGTWAENQLTSADDFTAFPRQSDQPGIVDWLEPLEGSDVAHDFVNTVINMDGSGKTEGGRHFTLFTPYWTPFMVQYFIENYPPGDMTVQHFDAGKGWLTDNCIMQPVDKTKGQRVGTGYLKIPLVFVNATTAPAGYGFTNGFSNGFNAPDA